MRKLLFLLTILALTFAAVGGFAATNEKVYKYVPKTTSGKPIPAGSIKFEGHDPASLAQFKAQNHLSYAMNQKIKNAALLAKKNTYINGTIDTVPYFSSWYITGNRNSIYPYSMAGQDPSAGGTTGINNQIIPLVSVLTVAGVRVYTFDPTVANDPQGSDISLFGQSPLYDDTTTYPGPPPQTGQIVDTAQRTAFRATAAANWHTKLNAPHFSGVIWVQTLEWNNGDWACISGLTPPCNPSNDFPVFNINTISNNFAFILSAESPPNNTVPIIITDWLTAFENNNPMACCVLGYHSTQPGIADPSGVLVWTWGTYIPYAADNGFTNPFGGFGYNSMVLSHEIAELVNDPFVASGGTSVSPWVDGSVSFAQGNLEVGDVIEGMSLADVVYDVPLTTTGGPFTFNLQNTALLEWFTRNPFNGGIYSWPNEGTLSHSPHNPGTCAGGATWAYGQGSAGFFFCNRKTGW